MCKICPHIETGAFQNKHSELNSPDAPVCNWELFYLPVNPDIGMFCKCFLELSLCLPWVLQVCKPFAFTQNNRVVLALIQESKASLYVAIRCILLWLLNIVN